MRIYSGSPYLLFFIVFFISIQSNAQFGLRGTVYTVDKYPVANAIVKIKDSANGLPRFFGITNTQGIFQIKLPAAPKRYWVECSLLGYKNQSLWIQVDSVQTKMDFYLASDTSGLPDIHVYSIPPITVSGDTTTFRVDAFKKGIESNVGELLSSIPGFSVNNGRISYNGKPVNTVLIEDDDLFGSDYNVLTQNLSPKGIEKIQLIQNYQDRTYLSNRLQKGQDIAVNLKFNKKYLYKVIGSSEAGVSIDPWNDFYKVRQNIVSLIPKFKSVTTTNFNNTGLLASEILGNGSNLVELIKNRNEAIAYDLVPRSIVGTGATIPDINSSILPKNKMVENTTEVITNNFLYKPSKKLQLKTILQYYQDRYQQQQQQVIDYTVSGSNLVIQNQQFIQKKMPFFNASSEIVFSPSTHTQFVYKAGFNARQESDSLDDIRQSFSTNTRFSDTYRRFQHQLGFSFSLDSNRIIDLRAMQVEQRSEITSNLFPADLYRSFTGVSGFEKLRSGIDQNNIEYLLQAKLTVKKSKHTITSDLTYSTNETKLQSMVSLDRNGGTFVPTVDSLRNQSVLRTDILTGTLSYERRLTKSVYFRTAQRFETGNLKYTPLPLVPQAGYLHYLPSIGFGFNFSQQSRLNLSADIRNVLPSVSNLAGGLLFANGNSIFKGSDNVQVGRSKNFTATYSFSEMTKKRMFGNASLFYSRTPLLYLPNIDPAPFYTVSDLFFLGKEASLTGLMLFGSKYLPKLKSQWDMAFQFNRVVTYYSTNEQLGAIQLRSSKISSRLKTLITQKLTANIQAQFTFTSQRIDPHSIKERIANNRISLYSTEFVYRFNSRWILNSKLQYVQQKRKLSSNDLYMGELLLKYLAVKDKLSFMISGNNLFNDGQFTDINFTQNSISVQSFQLLRPFWMLHMSLEF